MRVPDLWANAPPLQRTSSKSSRHSTGYVHPLTDSPRTPKLCSPQQFPASQRSFFAEANGANGINVTRKASSQLPPAPARKRSLSASAASISNKEMATDQACCAAYLYMREHDTTQFEESLPLATLRTLDLSINGIISCEFLWEAPSPNTLPVTRFPHLRHLYLTGNSLTSLNGLSGLPCLETLTLSSNQIRSLEGLCTLDSLRILSLHHNDLRTLKGFPSLPALAAVNLVGNPIADLPTYRAMVLSVSAPERIDNKAVLEDEYRDAIRIKGKVSFAVKEGFTWDGWLSVSETVKLAEAYMTRSQKEDSDLLEMLGIDVRNADRRKKKRAVEEGVQLELNLAVIDRRAKLDTTRPFYNKHIPPVEFRVEGKAESVHLFTGLNDFGTLIEMESSSEVRRRDTPGSPASAQSSPARPICTAMRSSPDSDEFVSTLYTTPGESLYRYVVDGEVVCDEPAVEGPDGGRYTHLYVPPSSEATADASNGAEDILHIRWLRSAENFDWEIIEDASSHTFTPAATEVGRHLRAEVLVYEGGWYRKMFYYVTSPVAPCMPSVSGLELLGEPFVGETATLNVQYQGGVEGASSVVWYRKKKGAAKKKIPQESGISYTLRAEDVDHMITAVYTPVRDDGEVGCSDEVTLPSLVLSTPPAFTDLRFSSEIAVVGQPISVEGIFTGGLPGTHIYEWKNPITGATKSCKGSSITPQEFDAGYQLLVSVTPVNNEGRRGRPVTVMSPTVVYGEPELTDVALIGPCEEGKSLRLSYKFVGGREGLHLVEWFLSSNSPPITSPVTPTGPSYDSLLQKEKKANFTYKLTAADVGDLVVCRVTPHRCDGLIGKAVVVRSGVITPTRPQAKIRIAGSPYTGDTLRLHVDYTGGDEGASLVQWGRVSLQDGTSPSTVTLSSSLAGPDCEWEEETSDPRNRHRPLSDDDLNCVIAVRYTPVRRDGVEGSMVTAKSTLIGPRMDKRGVLKRSCSNGGGMFVDTDLSQTFVKPERSHSVPPGGVFDTPTPAKLSFPSDVVEFDVLRAKDILAQQCLAGTHFLWETVSSAGRMRTVGDAESYLVTRSDVGKSLNFTATMPWNVVPLTCSSGLVMQSIRRFGVSFGEKVVWSDEDLIKSPSSRSDEAVLVNGRLEAKWIIQNQEVKIECFWEVFVDSKWTAVSKKEHFTPTSQEVGLKLRVVGIPIISRGTKQIFHERGTRVVQELGTVKTPKQSRDRLMSSTLKVASTPRVGSPKLSHSLSFKKMGSSSNTSASTSPRHSTLSPPPPEELASPSPSPSVRARKSLPPEARGKPVKRSSSGTFGSPKVRKTQSTYVSPSVEQEQEQVVETHENGITPETSPVETVSEGSAEMPPAMPALPAAELPASYYNSRGYASDDSDVEPMPRLSKRAALAARAHSRSEGSPTSFVDIEEEEPEPVDVVHSDAESSTSTETTDLPVGPVEVTYSAPAASEFQLTIDTGTPVVGSLGVASRETKDAFPLNSNEVVVGPGAHAVADGEFVLSVSSYDESRPSSDGAPSPTVVSTLTLPIPIDDASSASEEPPTSPVAKPRKRTASFSKLNVNSNSPAKFTNSLLGSPEKSADGGATPRKGRARSASTANTGIASYTSPRTLSTNFPSPLPSPRGASGLFKKPEANLSVPGRERRGSVSKVGTTLAIPGTEGESSGGGGGVKAKRTRSATSLRKPNLPLLTLQTEEPAASPKAEPKKTMVSVTVDAPQGGNNLLGVAPAGGGRRHRSATMMRPTSPASVSSNCASPSSPMMLSVDAGGAAKTPVGRKRGSSFLKNPSDPIPQTQTGRSRRLSVATCPSPRQRSGTFKSPTNDSHVDENNVFTTLAFPLGNRAEVGTTTPLLSHFKGNGAEGKSSFIWQKRYGGDGDDSWTDVKTADPYYITGNVDDAHCEFRVVGTPVNWKGIKGPKHETEAVRMRWGEVMLETLLKTIIGYAAVDVIVSHLPTVRQQKSVLTLTERKLKLRRSDTETEPFVSAEMDRRHLVTCVVPPSYAPNAFRLMIEREEGGLMAYDMELPPNRGQSERDFLVLLIRVWASLSDPEVCTRYLSRSVSDKWQKGICEIEEMRHREDLLRPAFESPLVPPTVPQKPVSRRETNIRTFATFCFDIALA